MHKTLLYCPKATPLGYDIVGRDQEDIPDYDQHCGSSTIWWMSRMQETISEFGYVTRSNIIFPYSDW